MTPSARWQAALDLSDLIDTTPRPADAVVREFFRARRYIGSKDRAAVAALVYALLRHRARLDWWLMTLKAEATARHRLIVYQRLIEGDTAQAVESLFTGGGAYGLAALEADDRKLLKALEGRTPHHPHMPEAVALECPGWAEGPLRARFGARFAEEMTALLEPAPLDLRVNTLKATRDDMLAQLRALRLAVAPCRLSPVGLRVTGRPALHTVDPLKEGAIEIQDEGSQLVALMADARPGQRIVDFCAGAGGKTLAMAATMQNKGRIIACDVLANRLKRSGERFRRAGVHCIETRALSSERDPWVKRHKGAFDRVLVDAPCSGTGTWRRNPDQRVRALGPGLETLVPLQAAILDSAARLVKPGGRLIYATCSLLAEENERQIDGFLATHPDFRLMPMADIWREVLGADAPPFPSDGPMLALTPAAHGTDGFFAAAMERTTPDSREKTASA